MEPTPCVVKTTPFAIGTKWNQAGTKPECYKYYIYANMEPSGTKGGTKQKINTSYAKAKVLLRALTPIYNTK